jgi:four helix bundle protein
MARDHSKLRVFHEAHQLTLAIYRETKGFPKDEWFGVRAQMRRAAVSIPANLVEGSARRTAREYLNFLNVARGSAAELHYLITLTAELGLLTERVSSGLSAQAERLIRQLQTLIRQVEKLAEWDRSAARRAAAGPEPRA